MQAHARFLILIPNFGSSSQVSWLRLHLVHSFITRGNQRLFVVQGQIQLLSCMGVFLVNYEAMKNKTML